MVRKILMLALATGAAGKLWQHWRSRHDSGARDGNNPKRGTSAGGAPAVSPERGPGPMQ